VALRLSGCRLRPTRGCCLHPSSHPLASASPPRSNGTLPLVIPTISSAAGPPQVLSLSAWYADVLKRHEQLAAWTAGPVVPPPSVWLPGLFNPKAFLTAVMQTYARAHGLPLDVMRFVTDVTPKGVDQVSGARAAHAGWGVCRGQREARDWRGRALDAPPPNCRAPTPPIGPSNRARCRRLPAPARSPSPRRWAATSTGWCWRARAGTARRDGCGTLRPGSCASRCPSSW
jgi:hypothetical protein